MYQIVELMIPISFFIMSFSIVYVIVTARHRERIAMIEAGMNPNEGRIDGVKRKRSTLRTALLLLFVPLGIYIGNIVSEVYPIIRNKEMGLLFAFIFGGIALVITYIVERVKSRNTEMLQKQID